MRLNKYIARATGVSRRKADELIKTEKVAINNKIVHIGVDVSDSDQVTINGRIIKLPTSDTVVIINKPIGYVCSRNAQAVDTRTIYDLLPENLKNLKTVGRLDKDSSGLVILTDNGDLAYKLTHPKFNKTKEYIVVLDNSLAPLHQQMIADFGISLTDGPSKLLLEKLTDDRKTFRVIMHEGRNRQIRRTFGALGYGVKSLHRLVFGPYTLPPTLSPGDWQYVEK